MISGDGIVPTSEVGATMPDRAPQKPSEKKAGKSAEEKKEAKKAKGKKKYA
jgi:hypothetical protein